MSKAERTGAPGAGSRFETQLAVLVVIILSAATVLTAWSSFEATKWSGLQSINFSRASATRTESLRASTTAGQQEIVDVSLFTAWLEASDQGQTALAGQIEARFGPTLRRAFTKWRADPSAADSPFDLPAYQHPENAEAGRLAALATEQFKEATVDNQRGADYVLMTVLFALALFFGAISSRLSRARLEISAHDLVGGGVHRRHGGDCHLPGRVLTGLPSRSSAAHLGQKCPRGR